jgi:hypothetical protein
MSEGYRRQVPPDRFRSELEADRETAAGDAAALARESGDRPVRAVVETARGDRISLILERGEWKLEEQPLAPYRQDTPRAAVRTYVRAVSERRYDVVLRLVPARRRAEVTLRALRAYWEGPGSETRLRALESLRAGLEGPIVETGAEARMPYGQDGMVRFLREDGVWKIADME